MSWQDVVVAVMVLAALGWVVRFSYCAAMRIGSGCSACPKCRARRASPRTLPWRRA